ncbi:MAG: glycosyltransferase, partial [Actinomycetes bacterium]
MTDTLKVSIRPQTQWKSRDIWCAVAGAVSLGLAVWGASTVSAPIDSDLGLVGVLPFPFWAGVLILNAAFVVALRGDATGPARTPVMLWLLAVFVVVLFGAAALVTDVPRGEVAFRHLGIADALSGSGQVDPTI